MSRTRNCASLRTTCNSIPRADEDVGRGTRRRPNGPLSPKLAHSAAWRDRTLLERYDAIQQAQGPSLRPFYVVAEKILAPGERLPEHWAVSGTTGYEFLNLLNGIFIDRRQADAADRIYVRLLRQRPSFSEIV